MSQNTSITYPHAQEHNSHTSTITKHVQHTNESIPWHVHVIHITNRSNESTNSIMTNAEVAATFQTTMHNLILLLRVGDVLCLRGGCHSAFLFSSVPLGDGALQRRYKNCEAAVHSPLDTRSVAPQAMEELQLKQQPDECGKDVSSASCATNSNTSMFG
jgi:hypothetical protein